MADNEISSGFLDADVLSGEQITAEAAAFLSRAPHLFGADRGMVEVIKIGGRT